MKEQSGDPTTFINCCCSCIFYFSEKSAQKVCQKLVYQMPWTPDQRQRLALEKDILEKYFPGKVEWVDPTGNTKVDVTMITNSNQTYCLRLYVPRDFPNCLPFMVVKSSPRPMPNWGDHNASHTLGRSNEGFLKICHYRSSHWNGQHTFYEVFVKGRLWLEAYEGHISTGNSIDYYLGHM